MSLLLDAFGRWPHTKIALRTRLDNEIENLQPWELASLEWKGLAAKCDRYIKSGTATPVSEECPVYNCHGLTFGNRRTSVADSPSLVSRILGDDGFEELKGKQPRTGDVVMYYGEDGDLLHSGLVIGSGGPPLNVPLIWSKWGKAYEMTHYVNQCPYDSSNVKYYRLSVWKPEIVFKTN